MKCNCKTLKAGILRLRSELAVLHERYAELLDKGITGNEDLRAEIIELKKEREILQSTIRSLKSRGQG